MAHGKAESFIGRLPFGASQDQGWGMSMPQHRECISSYVHGNIRQNHSYLQKMTQQLTLDVHEPVDYVPDDNS
jgi:hypothetical protein